jgi:hypothetical protein
LAHPISVTSVAFGVPAWLKNDTESKRTEHMNAGNTCVDQDIGMSETWVTLYRIDLRFENDQSPGEWGAPISRDPHRISWNSISIYGIYFSVYT